MSRPAVSIRRYGSFTFGSPSVLMMFHRTPGQMAEEVAVMHESMPYYYQVTREHGAGRGADHGGRGGLFTGAVR